MKAFDIVFADGQFAVFGFRPGLFVRSSPFAPKFTMVSTITATNRLSITNAETKMNGTKNSHACGYTSITGRTMPE